jgi:hypothetical protein
MKAKKTVKFESKPVEYEFKPNGSASTKEISNNSNKLETISKDCDYLDYLSHNSGRLFPEKDSWRQRLRYTMLKWSENPNSVELDQFCIEYQIPRSTLYFWRDKYPEIKQTYDDVKLILASRRRVGALQRKYDKDVVYRDLYKYDPEENLVDKRNAALKKDESNEKEKVGIVLPCYSSCCMKADK